MTIRSPNDYRFILQNEYERRLQRNPSYSLRAFARDLDVAPSRIVEVLNRKRGLSRVVASRMAAKLGFSQTETEMFFNMVDASHGRSRSTRDRAMAALGKLTASPENTLSADAFKTVADWYHYAILELTTTHDFESEHEWIAKRIAVDVTVVKAAIERLIRLELLSVIDGRWIATESATFSTLDIPSDGLKKHHEQIISKARQSIYFQSVEQRDLSAMTIAIDGADIPLAKEMIRKFCGELATALGSSAKKKNAVYCFSTQLFQLDQNQNENKNKTQNLNEPVETL